MAKRKVIFIKIKGVVTAPPAFSGVTTIATSKQSDAEMFTGIEPGFVTVFRLGIEVGIPIANLDNLIWEKVNDK